MNDLATQLRALGLYATAAGLDDLLATATQRRFAPRALLEHIAMTETADRSRRSLERRTVRSRLGTFKPIADFDWNWPKRIDRPLLERAIALDFLREGRNLVLLGPKASARPWWSKTSPTRRSSPATPCSFAPPPSCSTNVDCDSPEPRRRRIAAYDDELMGFLARL
jgi:hypothetical protein